MKFMPVVFTLLLSFVHTTFAQSPTTGVQSSPATAQATTQAPPPPTTPAAACSGHGTCLCKPGWTGLDCSQPKDWCTQPISEVAGRPPVKDVCGNRGTCESSPDQGASCHCFPGYSGTFCDQLDPSEFFLSNRCHAYNSSYAQGLHWSPDDQIGCAAGQECVPDDIQCLLTMCPTPIGWCLPNPRAKPLLSEYKIREFEGKQWFYKDNAKDATPCSGHGACNCAHGYQGADCETEVDWCDTPAPGFNETHFIKEACGINGTCVTQPAGAYCICAEGFTGQFCDQIIPEEIHISRRCYAYPPKGPPQPYVTIYCPRTDEACVPENLQCFVPLTCANPIGWCMKMLPHATPPQFLEMLARLFTN